MTQPVLRDIDILLILRRETHCDWAVIYPSGETDQAYWQCLPSGPKEFPTKDPEDTGYMTVDATHVVDENGVILEGQHRAG